IGGIYGLWQLPLIFFSQPQAFAGVDWMFAMLAILGFSIAISFPAAWLTIRSRSIYASATFLGVMGNLAPLSFFFTYNVHPLIGSTTGFAGMLTLLVITFLIIRFDHLMGEDYDKWVF
ncbi:MAG: hypothetical protein AAF804_08680, partial [Bacteroidota bacterium]